MKGAAVGGAPRGYLRRGLWAALVLWIVALASCSAIDTVPGTGEGAPREPTLARPPAKRAQASAPFDLDGVMRQVHFAFRQQGALWTGGHTNYEVRASVAGFSVRPASPAAQGAEATFETVSVSRGARGLRGEGRVEKDGHLAIVRGEVTEHLRNDEEGVEQSFSFDERPAGTGDLEFRVRVTGQAYAGETSAGHHFVDPATGLGLRYGLATWIDGRGERTAVPVRYAAAEGELVLTVPAAVVEDSEYPAVLDPTIGPELGMDAPIYFPVSAAQTLPSVAFDGTNYLVTWIDTRTVNLISGNKLQGTRVTPAGVVLDPGGIEIGVGLGTFNPSKIAVTFSGTHYFVAWGTYGASEGVVYGARVTPAGVVLDPTAKKYGSYTNYAPTSLDVAVSGTKHLIAWTVNGDVYGALVDANGTALGSQFPISTHSSIATDVSVASDGTDFLAAWVDTRNNNVPDIYGARVNEAGAVLDPGGLAISISAQGQSTPSVAFDGTNYFVVWGDDKWGNRDIYGARVSPSGAVLDPLGVEVCKSAGTQTQPSVAFDGTQYVVVWNDNRTGDQDIWQGRVSVAGATLDGTGTPVAVATNQQSRPALACGSGACFAAWEDLRAGGSNPAAYGAHFSGTTVDTPQGVMLLSAANQQEAPSVASDGTNYLVVWQDLRTNTTPDIYAARVSSAGEVLDPSGIQVSAATGEQSAPKVVWGGTQYMVVWQDKRSGTFYDVYAARVSADGVVADPAGIPLVAVANRHEQAPILAFDGTNYLVAWQDSRLTYLPLYGSLLTQAGTLLQPTGFQIAATNNMSPAVAFGGNQYLVVWQAGSGGSLGPAGLRGARVTTAGTTLDSTSGFAIRSTVTSSLQAVAFDGLNFVVAYASTGMYMARVTAAATVIDTLDVQISPYGGSPAITFDGTDCLVVWRDGRHGANGAIYGSWVTEAGDVLTPGGQPFAGNGATNHGSPALASDGAGHLLLAYMKGETATPFGSNRIRARLLTTSQPLGAACSAPTDCASGFCADGVCCDTSCGGSALDCQACSVALGGSADGTCTPLTGATCDDGNACTQADTCDAGTCVGADPVICEAQDECHDPGSCDPATGTCNDPQKEDGEVCSGGTCMGGVCQSGGSGAGGGGGSGGESSGAGPDPIAGEPEGASDALGSAGSAGCQATGAPARGAPIAALLLAAGLLVRRRVTSRRREAQPSRA